MAKCKACGAEASAAMKFCGACGAEIERETEEAAPPERGKEDAPGFRKYLKPAIIAAAAVVAVIIAVNVLKPAKYERTKGSVYISQGDGSVVVIPHNKAKTEVDGYLSSSARSLDGTAAAVLVGESGGYGAEGFNLYLITDSPQMITEGVYACWMAASGRAVAYTKEYDPAEGTAELWIYADGKNTKVTSDFSARDQCAISPNGKTLAYVTYNGDNYKGVIWDGKVSELGRDIEPVAVADGARYVYYTKNESLYVQKGTDGDSKEKLGEYISAIYANKNLSQIVYNADTKGYISRNGGKRESLSGVIDSLMTPNGTALQRASDVSIYGVSSFADTFYFNLDGSLIHINGKYETGNVARNIGSSYLANDAKTITYLKNGSIYKMDGGNAGVEAELLADRDVVAFVATADGGAVFFINDDYEIYCQKGKGKPASVSNDYSSRGGGSRYGLFNGKTFFYISDDELCYSTGGKGKSVSGIEGKVTSVSAGLHSVSATAEDGPDTYYYRSADGSKFDLVRQE